MTTYHVKAGLEQGPETCNTQKVTIPNISVVK